jgi:hypothetical protein
MNGSAVAMFIVATKLFIKNEFFLKVSLELWNYCCEIDDRLTVKETRRWLRSGMRQHRRTPVDVSCLRAENEAEYNRIYISVVCCMTTQIQLHFLNSLLTWCL